MSTVQGIDRPIAQANLLSLGWGRAKARRVCGNVLRRRSRRRCVGPRIYGDDNKSFNGWEAFQDRARIQGQVDKQLAIADVAPNVKYETLKAHGHQPPLGPDKAKLG